MEDTKGSCFFLSYYVLIGPSLCSDSFHSETCILTTIFGLLFWDIIFADIPGAFETPYQIAPLDLVEDSFYYARKELIKSRLKELKDGDSLKILDRHDKLYRESKTWCVGVRWDVCGKDELAEIVEVNIDLSRPPPRSSF